jgi:hypothetical protein
MMHCKCNTKMEMMGTQAGGIAVYWCPSCGTLFHRSMNPRLPGEAWTSPKKSQDHPFSALDLTTIFKIAHHALAKFGFVAVAEWIEAPTESARQGLRSLRNELDRHLHSLEYLRPYKSEEEAR